MRGKFISHVLIGCGFGVLLGVAALNSSLPIALGGLLSILLLIGIAKRPEFGMLAIVFVTAGINPDIVPLLRLGPISLYITDVILLYLVALVLIRAFILKNLALVRTPLDLPVLWFYLAIVLSAIIAITQFSLDPHWVFRRVRPLTYYLGFFAVTNLIREKRQLALLVNGLFVIAVVASIALFIHLFFPSVEIFIGRSNELETAGRDFAGVMRSYSPSDRVIYPILLVSVCSLSFGGKWCSQPLEFVRTGILSLGLFLIFQRNYLWTMILMLALLVTLVSRSERARILRWAVLGISILALLLALTAPYTKTYLEASADRLFRGMKPSTLAQDNSILWRVTETQYGIQSILKHPFIGIGLGNFYRPWISDLDWNPDDSDKVGLRWYIHNAYLWVWIYTGLIGFIPFVWIYVAFLVRGFTRWRKVTDSKLRVLVLGFTLGILGQAICNFVAPNFVQSWVLFVFALILGVNEIIFRWELSPRGLGKMHLTSSLKEREYLL